MALPVARMRVLVALAAVGLVIAAAAAIGLAANGEWLVSVLCAIGGIGFATSLYVRITLLKSHRLLARPHVIGDLVRSPPASYADGRGARGLGCGGLRRELLAG
jgi:hypothetical protein